MGAQIYLALLSRLERHGRVVLADEVRPELTQFVREAEGFTPSLRRRLDQRAATDPHRRVLPPPVGRAPA